MDQLSLIKSSLTPYTDQGLKEGKNLCPLHEENTPSFNITQKDGVYFHKCFGCGASGTIVDLYMGLHDVEAGEAIRELEDRYGDGSIKRTSVYHDPVDTARLTPEKKRPIPCDGPKKIPGRYFNKKGEYKGYSFMPEIKDSLMPADADTWTYQWAEVDGVKMCWAVARWNNVKHRETGEIVHKVIRPFFFDGEHWHGFFAMDNEVYRPLYNAHKFKKGEEVFVVEGEKDMDALESLLAYGMLMRSAMPMNNIHVTTFIGGANAIQMTDWSPLYGHDVIIWTDNDTPGRAAASWIAKYLSRNKAVVDIVEPFPYAGHKDDEHWAKGAADFTGDIDEFWTGKVERVRYDETDIEEVEEEVEEVEEEDSIAEILADIACIEDHEGVMEILARLSRMTLDPVEVEVALQSIKALDHINIGLSAMRESLKKLSLKHHVDPGRFIAYKVRDEIFGGQLMRTEETYWCYRGTHWKKVSEEDMMFFVSRIIEKYAVEFGKVSHARLAKDAMVLLPALVMNFEERPFDNDHLVINCQNGELWYEDERWVLKKHDPKSRLIHCLDIHYNPDEEAPEFMAALDKIFQGDMELVDMLLELFGFCMTRWRPVDAFFLCVGSGANGKSKLFELLSTHMIGNQFCLKMDIGLLTSTPSAVSGLHGKMMIIDDDVKKNTRLNDGLLKQVSSYGHISADRKYKDYITFKNYAVPVMLCNNLPKVFDNSYGFSRRTHVIPFDHIIPPEERDPFLFERIARNEKAGVLNAILPRLTALMKRGKFSRPKAVVEATEKWLGEANVYQRIGNELLSKVEDEESTVTAKELMTEFKRSSFYNSSIKMNTIGEELSKIGFDVRSTSNRYGQWRIWGVRFAA